MTSRYFLIICAFLIIIFGSAGFAFVLRPSLEAFRIARNAVNETALQVKELDENLSKMQALTAQATLGSAAEIEKLKRIFIGSPELAYVLTSIPKYAEATRFLVTSLDVGASPAGRTPATGPLRQIPIQVQLKGGGYRELKEFLKLMTTSIPLFDITSLTFDPDSATVSISFNASAIQEDPSRPVPLDPKFFEDPRFSALHDPFALPVKDPVGKVNPFAATAKQ